MGSLVARASANWVQWLEIRAKFLGDVGPVGEERRFLNQSPGLDAVLEDSGDAFLDSCMQALDDSFSVGRDLGAKLLDFHQMLVEVSPEGSPFLGAHHPPSAASMSAVDTSPTGQRVGLLLR